MTYTNFLRHEKEIRPRKIGIHPFNASHNKPLSYEEILSFSPRPQRFLRHYPHLPDDRILVPEGARL